MSNLIIKASLGMPLIPVLDTKKYEDLFEVSTGLLTDDRFKTISKPANDTSSFIPGKTNIYFKTIRFDLVNLKGPRNYSDTGDIIIDSPNLVINSQNATEFIKFNFPGWNETFSFERQLDWQNEPLSTKWDLSIGADGAAQNYLYFDDTNLQDAYYGRLCFVQITLTGEIAAND